MKQPRNQAGFWTAPKDLRVHHLGFGVLGARFRSGASSVQRGDFVMEKAGTFFGRIVLLEESVWTSNTRHVRHACRS